jgi:hypothetical protein
MEKLLVVNAVRCDNHSSSRPPEDDHGRFQPLRDAISQNLSSAVGRLMR